MDDLASDGIDPIDLVVVNLYPFAAHGGPKAGATPRGDRRDDRHRRAGDGAGGGEEPRPRRRRRRSRGLRAGARRAPRAAALSREATRRRLAAKAFRRTVDYDAAVASLPRGPAASGRRSPRELRLDLPKVLDLVYGENPHQTAAFYRESRRAGADRSAAPLLQGKPLSFNNILDFDAALALAAELGPGAAASS